MKRRRPASAVRLSKRIRPLFWDYDFGQLTWEADSDLIIGRILAAGDWEAIQWLRRLLPEPVLRDWLVRRHGAGLNSRQLRFWELVLELPRRLVNTWLSDPGRQVWEGRRHA
ncbi:MAG TPA: hypothetical protein VNX28_13530 [Gemmataceae bacterium]|nr:hypothetical protein [Gemmataceae bacterium]